MIVRITEITKHIEGHVNVPVNRWEKWENVEIRVTGFPRIIIINVFKQRGCEPAVIATPQSAHFC